MAAYSLLAGVQPVRAQLSIPKWDVEAHVGGDLVGTGGGDAILPPPAGSFSTVGGRPTERVSSWYFGDGARLLNDVLGRLAVPGTMTPLDPVLSDSIGEHNGVTFGVRVGRAIGNRLRAEVSVDYLRDSVGFDESVSEAIEATRSGFEVRWRGLLATGPFTSSNAFSTATMDGGGSQLLVIGALNINLLSPVISDLLPLLRKFVPFVTVGAGVLSYTGDPLHITIDGLYQFSLPSLVHVSEADSVRVQYSTPDNTFVGVVGGGFTYDVTDRIGVRTDARFHFGPNRIKTTISASPLVVVQSPAGFIASDTSPSIQFSNDPALGVESSLSGPTIVDFETFRGAGLNRRLTLTGGLYFRF